MNADNWTAKHFAPHEMACKCCGALDMNDHFMGMLDNLREEVCMPVIINSGYRCPKHNAEIGGSKNSAHLEGKAADIRVGGHHAATLLYHAFNLGFKGYGIKQNGPFERRFIHLDTASDEPGRPRDWVWSYK